MLRKYLLVAIVGFLTCSLALGPNLVKSQAQPQKPTSPSKLLSPSERLNNWAKNSPSEPIPVGIFFDRRIPDAQLLQLMQRYNVRPKAVYMSVAGMSGTHRNYEDKDAGTVIAEARRETVEMMLKSRDSSQVRAEEFVKLHPKEEFLTQATKETAQPQVDAKSLLENIEQNEAALERAEDNLPLIYGAEVVGSIDNIKKLGADPMIKVFEPAVKVGGKTIVPQPTLPEQIQTSQDLGNRPLAIRRQKIDETYKRLENIARRGIKEGNQ